MMHPFRLPGRATRAMFLAARSAGMACLLVACLLALAAGAPAQDAPPAGPNYTSTPIPRFEEDPKGDQIRIVPETVMTVEENLAYGGGRTIVYYGDRTLEADRLIIDLVTLEAQAEGNVVLRGPKEEIRAKAARFNFRHYEGVAWGVDGRYDALYFKARQNEEEKGPAFRRISEVESLFRGTQMTSCDYPVPHYHVRAREIILVDKRKIMFRGMTLYLRRYPILYLPWYTRTFESSPWETEVGYSSSAGFFIHIGYRYVHEMRTPDWIQPKKYVTRTRGQLDATFDYFTQLGPGAGLRYQYSFDYERHRGDMQIYGIRDGTAVDILGNKGGTDKDADRGQRYIYRHEHNTRLGRTIWQYNVDWVSDPDVYYDVVDRFAPPELERGRISERRYRLAGTYFRSNWLARLMLDHKERVGRDRYTDFSEPYTDDLDFDPNPDDLEDDDKSRTRGLSEDRFGVVRDYYSARWATSLIKLWGSPLYWRSQFNAFQGLDYGFNVLDTGDDDSVTGVDFYNSLTSRIRFSERYTWTNTLGIGVGSYSRGGTLVDSKELDRNRDETFVDTLRVKDEETIILGSSDQERSLSDVSDMTPWADFRSRLNGRFTDSLQGSLTYTFRKTMGMGLGEFYESIGRTEARDEIYDFPSDYHWVEAFLNYYLLYPKVNTFVFAARNLQSGGDIYANEASERAGIGGSYESDSREFAIRSSIYYQTTQIRDPADPNAFRQGGAYWTGEMEYSPRHRRWWTKLRATAETKFDDDPADDRSDEEKDRYDEEDSRISIIPLIGGQVGPKHIAEFSMTWDSRFEGIRRYGFTIIRDLHDAELRLFLGARNDSSRARGSSGGNLVLAQSLEFKASLKLKMPGTPVDVRRGSITTLADRRQDVFFVE